MRLVVTLDHAEGDALARMAHNDLRDPREQLRWLLREELARRGLLSPSDVPAQEGHAAGRDCGRVNDER